MKPCENKRIIRRKPRRQGGAALIVSLILLLVMTILGLTAMNSSILQSFMSASYQEQTVRLATAENVLLEGEFDVEDLVENGVLTRAADGYYLNLITNPGPGFAATDPSAYSTTNFVIEYMGEFLIPGESVAEGGGLEDSLVHIFRVSARSQRPEEERGGLRIVQSLYVTLRAPNE